MIQTENFNKDVNVLAPELRQKFGVGAAYVLFECDVCHRRWGVSIPIDNMIRPDQACCQRCSINKVVKRDIL